LLIARFESNLKMDLDGNDEMDGLLVVNPGIHLCLTKKWEAV
jgi:hypothetical protein